MYAGAGVTLGHNFPFYMNFKGGKGIAVMAGLVVVNSFCHLPASLLLIPVTLACFLLPVVATRYISVGSLTAYTVFLIEMIVIGQWGWFDYGTGPVHGTVCDPCTDDSAGVVQTQGKYQAPGSRGRKQIRSKKEINIIKYKKER